MPLGPSAHVAADGDGGACKAQQRAGEQQQKGEGQHRAVGREEDKGRGAGGEAAQVHMDGDQDAAGESGAKRALDGTLEEEGSGDDEAGGADELHDVDLAPAGVKGEADGVVDDEDAGERDKDAGRDPGVGDSLAGLDDALGEAAAAAGLGGAGDDVLDALQLLELLGNLGHIGGIVGVDADAIREWVLQALEVRAAGELALEPFPALFLRHKLGLAHGGPLRDLGGDLLGPLAREVALEVGGHLERAAHLVGPEPDVDQQDDDRAQHEQEDGDGGDGCDGDEALPPEVERGLAADEIKRCRDHRGSPLRGYR